MANGPQKQRLIPSILDRLTDNVEDIHESVARHLEHLLNTRCRCVGWPADYRYLNRSLVGYGIPDFTGANASSPQEVRQFLHTIEKVIQEFEPRFKAVKVKPKLSREPEDRVLRFRVEGVLHDRPWSDSSENEVFDYKMEPETGGFVQDHDETQ